uniref:T4 RNA ligase 1-like N-terminal domain-containing protein n=1 Tax=viral metagenome TaxID=1070528 RepID=A0A6C0JUU3_9ZZZZ
MSVVLNHFESLRERYPTWAELKVFLTSPEGGALRVIESESGEPYAIIRYVKGESRFNVPGTGLFRSVAWDTVNNRPVCMAPAKANEGSPPLNVNFVSIQDFLDGVMIQAFVTAEEPTVLRIRSRTKMGANNGFYSSKTFNEMFVECLAATPVRTTDTLLMHLRETMSEMNATSAFASFVLQHPEHRIVEKLHSPDLNIVHVGTVNATGAVVLCEHSSEWLPPLRRLQIPSYPVKMFHTDEDIQSLMRRTAVQNGFRWQGLVFKDGVGGRWRMRSPGYMLLRTLRGAEAGPVDRFLRLRREGKVTDYLKHYSDERKEFWVYETNLRQRTEDALMAYVAVHKAHTLKFAALPVEYKPVVHLLHVEYLNNLRAQKETVKLSHVIRVVNSLKEFEQRRLLSAQAFQAPVAEPLVAEPPVAEPPVAEPPVTEA